MKPERIQLHSDVGRAMLLFWAYARWWMPLVTAWLIALAHILSGLRRFPVVPIIWCVLVVLLSRWASRNATPVFATLTGLDMPGRRHAVAWSAVTAVRELPFVGGLVFNVYRITFDDGTAPLTFYGVHDLERIVRRFKASSRPVSVSEPADQPAVPAASAH
jgi:hypothetical protein